MGKAILWSGDSPQEHFENLTPRNESPTSEEIMDEFWMNNISYVSELRGVDQTTGVERVGTAIGDSPRKHFEHWKLRYAIFNI